MAVAIADSGGGAAEDSPPAPTAAMPLLQPPPKKQGAANSSKPPSARDLRRFDALEFRRVLLAGGCAASGGSPPAHAWPDVLVPLHQLERSRLLGRGAYGTVHLARPQGLPHSVAVKCTLVRTASSAELQALRKLSARPHPSLLCCEAAYHAQVQTTAEAEGKGEERRAQVELLVLPYLGGGDLFAALRHESCAAGLGEARALAYSAQVALGLQHLHESLRVAHCDVKPENILLTAGGERAVLTDFGLAVAVGDGADAATAGAAAQLRCGTLYFTPPELLHAVLPGAAGTARTRLCRADFWALGCVLFELLSGSGPWDTGPVARRAGPSPRTAEAVAKAKTAERAKLRKRIAAGRWELPPTVSGAARNAVAALLAKDEHERVCSVAGLAATEFFSSLSGGAPF